LTSKNHCFKVSEKEDIKEIDVQILIILFDVCNSNQTGKGEAAGIVDIFTRGVNPRLLRPHPG